MKEPSGEELIGEDRRPSRFAVPLSTLTGGAFVASTDQVEVHPDPPRPETVEAMPAPLADGSD